MGASSTAEAEAVARFVLANAQLPPERKEWLETALRNHKVRPVSKEQSDAAKAQGKALAAKYMAEIREVSKRIAAKEEQSEKKKDPSTK